MNNHLEILKTFHGIHPRLGNCLTLFFGEHITLTTGAIDEYTLEAIALEQSCIFGNNRQVDTTVSVHGSERGVNKTFNFFHVYK